MKAKKIISIIAIIVGALLVLGGVAPMIIGAILRMQISESVGIIGGADGPTAVFVACTLGAGKVIMEILLGLLLMIAGIVGIRMK